MPSINLSHIVQTVSLKDLHRLAVLKEQLDKLRYKRSALHRRIRAIDKKLQPIRASLPPYLEDPSNLIRIRRAIEKARKERRPRQPTIETLMVQILQEKKRPLSVRELVHGLLNEKGYKTTSPSFGTQIRVLLYRNRKGLYQRVGTGRFTLAGDKAPVPERGGTRPKAVSKKREAAVSGKKAVARRMTA